MNKEAHRIKDPSEKGWFGKHFEMGWVKREMTVEITMNKKQKICLLVGITVFVVLGLFPRCWVATGPGRNPIPRRWFILNYTKAFVIDDPTFFYIQQGLIGLTTGGLFLAFRDKKPKDEQKQ